MNNANFYEVSYTKKVGGNGTMTVKAQNEKEALTNAKQLCYTGSDFAVIGQVPPTADTAKGPGRQRMNK